MTSAPAAEPFRGNEVDEMEANPLDKRVQRRAARHAQSRVEILDAAEQVFGEGGPRHGSIRRIAELSGFSPAGIYLFFESKQHLLAETLMRRGDEWIGAVRGVTEGDDDPMEMLHRIVDTGDRLLFPRYPYFRLLLRHIDRGATMTEPVGDGEGHYLDVVTQIGNVITKGQRNGQIRAGGTSPSSPICTPCSLTSSSFSMLRIDQQRMAPFQSGNSTSSSMVRSESHRRPKLKVDLASK